MQTNREMFEPTSNTRNKILVHVRENSVCLKSIHGNLSVQVTLFACQELLNNGNQNEEADCLLKATYLYYTRFNESTLLTKMIATTNARIFLTFLARKITVFAEDFDTFSVEVLARNCIIKSIVASNNVLKETITKIQDLTVMFQT